MVHGRDFRIQIWAVSVVEWHALGKLSGLAVFLVMFKDQFTYIKYLHKIISRGDAVYRGFRLYVSMPSRGLN